MKGTFYGVGVGPGDPELLTLKAVHVIARAPVVAFPKGEGETEGLAYQIARPYIKPDARLLPLPFVMERNLQKRRQGRRLAADMVCEALSGGQDVCFLTLGDPSLYSTCMYVVEELKKDGYPVVMVPGVPAVCAMAAALLEPLAMEDEALLILPMSKGAETLPEALSYENLALMKVAKKIPEIRAAFEKAEESRTVLGISDCGLETERQYPSLEEMEKERLSYFTSMLVKRKGEREW